MKNKRPKTTSTLSLSIFIISVIVAFLYKFNNTTQMFVQEQIPIITNYGINTVCLGIVILGLIIALVFRNQTERYSDDGDDGDDDGGRLPYPSPHNPPDPPYHSPEQQTEKTVSAEPIVQPIIIQPIIKQPISNDDSHRDHHNNDNNSNSQHQQHNHQLHSNYNSNYKKKPIIRNYWKPKARKKKKLIFRNYWDPRSWNSR